jgi:hypothetical protein
MGNRMSSRNIGKVNGGLQEMALPNTRLEPLEEASSEFRLSNVSLPKTSLNDLGAVGE